MGIFKKQQKYLYDSCGNRAVLINQDGSRVTCTYDPVGRVTEAISTLGERIIHEYEYDATGRQIVK